MCSNNLEKNLDHKNLQKSQDKGVLSIQKGEKGTSEVYLS
jgi:hypothetical protein